MRRNRLTATLALWSFLACALVAMTEGCSGNDLHPAAGHFGADAGGGEGGKDAAKDNAIPIFDAHLEGGSDAGGDGSVGSCAPNTMILSGDNGNGIMTPRDYIHPGFEGFDSVKATFIGSVTIEPDA